MKDRQALPLTNKKSENNRGGLSKFVYVA